MSHGYIYQIINVLNNHSYIGYTKNLIYRMEKHFKSIKNNTVLYRAIRKYGIDNFVVKILEQPLLEDLSEREKYWIKFFDTYKNGYNMTEGGDGGALTRGLHPYNYMNVDEIRIKKLRKENYSIDDIAKIMSCSKKVIWRVLGKSGCKYITKKDRVNKKQLKIDLLNKSLPIFEIQKKYNISGTLLKKLSLEIFNNDIIFIKQNVYRNNNDKRNYKNM